jgi:hypothetical protein
VEGTLLGVGDGIGVTGGSVAVAAVGVLARQPANNSKSKDVLTNNGCNFSRWITFSSGSGIDYLFAECLSLKLL